MEEYEQAVFISYAWGGESEEIVNQIDRALEQQGLRIIRDKGDLGYKGSISAFMERIGQGNCVIVVISDKYLRSPNCMFELVEIAEGKQFHDRVFPIVLSNAEIYDPVKRLEYVKHWEAKRGELAQAMKEVDPANLQGIREDMDLYDRIRDKISGLTSILKDMNTLTPDTHRDSDFSEIYSGIERRMAEVQGLLKPTSGDSPYMGLRYFDTSDAALFYGREALTDELLARVKKESFVAIVGASGSGKSSVVRAGLIPTWNAATIGTVHVITPTARPLENLAASLTHDSESVTATFTLMDDLQKDARSLRLYVRKMLSASGGPNLLLVVDQFEETFTLCKNTSERKSFIESLVSLADEGDGVARVVITLRADFYHHCAEYDGLRLALEKHQVYIRAMTQDELRKAITAPAEKNGWGFQPGLVDLILDDVGTEPGALPLLSHALLETWKRQQGRMLTLQGYADAGGVKRAIAQTAESVYAHLSPAEQIVARSIFLRLTELGEGTQDTRRRVRLDELVRFTDHEMLEKVLKTLIDARLVTTEEDSAEVAHEALIREWRTLRKWLDEDRESLRLHRHLIESAAEWQRRRREASELYRGTRLKQIQEWMKGHGEELSPLEREFLKASRAADQTRIEAERAAIRDREKLKDEQRNASRLRSFLTIFGVLLLLAVVSTIIALNSRQEANIARDDAQKAREETQLLAFAGESFFEIERKPERAMVLALASVPTNTNSYPPIVSRAIYGVFDNALIRKVLQGHTGNVRGVAWSPDGKRIITGSFDKTARVWDAATGQEVYEPLKHIAPVLSVAWSPDGNWLLTGCEDHIARIWDARTGQMVKELLHDEVVNSVAWSPDGKRILTASGNIYNDNDHVARIWDAESGAELLKLEGHTAIVFSAAWSPDGRQVITGSGDKTARIWDATTGEQVRALTGHADGISRVAWSPDGTRVLTGSDGTARIWNATTGDVVFTLDEHTQAIWDVAWSPDGQRVLTGSNDKTARIWDAATGEVIQILGGHTDWVLAVAWSPDGRQLLTGTGGGDGTVRIWDATAETRVFKDALAVAWSPDSQKILTGSKEGDAQIWNAATGKLERTLSGHTDAVWDVEWSPDGNQVLTGSRDQTARIWDAATGQPIWTLEHDRPIVAVAWSPDSKLILTGIGDWYETGDIDWNQTAWIWEAETGRLVRKLKGHQPQQTWSVAWEPDGKRILTGGRDWTARIWDAATGVEEQNLHDHGRDVTAVAWSPDSKFVLAGTWDSETHVWDVATGIQIRTLVGHGDVVGDVAWSPDGKQIVSGSRDRTARIWDAETGGLLRTLDGPLGEVLRVSWSPDGRWVAAGSVDGTVYIWVVDRRLIAAEITRRVCNFYRGDDDAIRKEIPGWNWLGCQVALTAVSEDLKAYDAWWSAP